MDKESINLLDELNINKTLESFNKMFKTLCNEKEEHLGYRLCRRREENFDIVLSEVKDKRYIDIEIYKNTADRKSEQTYYKRMNIYDIIKDNKINNPEDILNIIEDEIINIKETLKKISLLYSNLREHSLSLEDTLLANHNTEELKKAIVTMSRDEKERPHAIYLSNITSIPNIDILQYVISYKFYDDMEYSIRIDFNKVDKQSNSKLKLTQRYSEVFDILDFVIEKDFDINKILETLSTRISYLVETIYK